MRRLLVLVLLVMIAPALWAAGEKLPIWRVSSGDATVVLLGSVHLAYSEIYPLRDEIVEAFDQADTLVVEVDVTGPRALEIQQMILQRGMLPPDQTLDQLLSEPVWKALKKYLRSRGLPVEGFLGLHPALVVSTLGTMRLMELGMRPDMGIDQHFLKLARDNKPIVELETAEQQLELLMGFPDADLLMEQTLIQLGEIDLGIRAIYEAWKVGDAQQLNQLLLEDDLAGDPRFRELYELMFDRRNYAMAEKIEAYLAGGENSFVVVGAGHLVGSRGIIAILEQRGFELWQM
jgi:uncharacterized protein